jgi:hypothetical protein
MIGMLFFLALGAIRMAPPARADSQPGVIDPVRPLTPTDEKIFDNGVWWITKSSITFIQSPMTVRVNGVDQGSTYLLQFGHLKSANDWPTIAAIYNTGYVRLTPPGLPFGTSFILGPAYWDSNNNYVHNIQISQIDIDTTSATPTGSLRLTIRARDYKSSLWPNYRLDITYEITLPDPTADSTTMVIRQTYVVINAFSLSANRQASHEGFKHVQFSSMYINDNYHDSDSANYIDSNTVECLVAFAGLGCNKSIFDSPLPLSARYRWAQLRHSDDVGWQGNTPNAIIQLADSELAKQTTPQGYITCSANFNDDNVGLWLNHDSAPSAFSPGASSTIEYVLIAQDNPLIPMPPLAPYAIYIPLILR